MGVTYCVRHLQDLLLLTWSMKLHVLLPLFEEHDDSVRKVVGVEGEDAAAVDDVLGDVIDDEVEEEVGSDVMIVAAVEDQNGNSGDDDCELTKTGVATKDGDVMNEMAVANVPFSCVVPGCCCSFPSRDDLR